MAGIYEVRNEEGLIKTSFAVQAASNKWVLVVKDMIKGALAVKSMAISHAALARLLEIVDSNINLDEINHKLQFQGEDVTSLFEKNGVIIETKRYGGTYTQFLTLYTEVLSKEEAHEDKVEIYLQKNGDFPIKLCLGIRRWKNEKPTKTGINLKEEMLEALHGKLADLKMLAPSSRKRPLSLIIPSSSGSAESDAKKKKKENITAQKKKEHVDDSSVAKILKAASGNDDEMLQKAYAELQEEDADVRVQEAYAKILLKRIFKKAKEYCEKCSTTEIYSTSIDATDHKQDCMVHNAFRFLSFHISYVNADMLAEGKESFKKSMFDELKNGRLTQTIKSNVGNLYDELSHTNLSTSVYLLQILNRIINNLVTPFV